MSFSFLICFEISRFLSENRIIMEMCRNFNKFMKSNLKLVKCDLYRYEVSFDTPLPSWVDRANKYPSGDRLSRPGCTAGLVESDPGAKAARGLATSS